MFQFGAMLLLLCGCATKAPPEAEVENTDAMLHLKVGLRPENLLFPEYLLMADFEIDQHGRIPESSLVGASLKTKLGVKAVLRRFSDMLATKGWGTTALESTEHFFRLLAVMKGETLEIRAVQGTGPTQVFILYQPKPEIPVAD